MIDPMHKLNTKDRQDVEKILREVSEVEGVSEDLLKRLLIRVDLIIDGAFHNGHAAGRKQAQREDYWPNA